jgi:hypothetical protein
MERESSAFLRALRGSRSQQQWARRLGYRGNPITDWERGERFPTAEETLRAAAISGIDVSAALRRFAPKGVVEARGRSVSISAWLESLRGRTSLVELAARSGRSRFSVARFLNGDAKPRLPDFFRLVDALTGRLPDFVAEFVPIAAVPSLERRFTTARAARSLAFEVPWSEAVLRLLETEAYRKQRRHQRGFIAERLGIPLEHEVECLRRLLEADIVERRGTKYHVSDRNTVDTQGGARALHDLKRHWATVAAERLVEPRDADFFAYNVMSMSRDDLDRVRELLRGAFREIRSLVAASKPEQVAALVNLELVTFEPSSAGMTRASGLPADERENPTNT